MIAEGGKPGAGRELLLDPPAMEPGSYKIRYHVLSSDGHLVQGRYEFFLDKP